MPEFDSPAAADKATIRRAIEVVILIGGKLEHS
jgi:hypothetical protein